MYNEVNGDLSDTSLQVTSVHEDKRQDILNGWKMNTSILGSDGLSRSAYLEQLDLVCDHVMPTDSTACPPVDYTAINLCRDTSERTDSRPYCCAFCKVGFTKKGHLDEHIRTHTGERPFSCSFCDSKFYRQSTLKEHVRTHTGEKPFVCTECDARFSRKTRLREHKRTHTGERPYGCTFCNSKFSLLSVLKDHIRIHTGEKPFSCTECEAAFSKRTNLKQHMKKHAREQLRYQINTSAVLTSTSANLETDVLCTNHVENLELSEGQEGPATVSGTDGKPFGCSECSARFTQKKDFTDHLQSHSGPLPYLCSFCDRTFCRQNTFNEHVRIHIGDKPFHCTECEATFARKRRLNQHKRTHLVNTSKTFTCSLCDSKYSMLSALEEHQKKHTEQKRINSSECDAAFVTNNDLKEHLTKNCVLLLPNTQPEKTNRNDKQMPSYKQSPSIAGKHNSVSVIPSKPIPFQAQNSIASEIRQSVSVTCCVTKSETDSNGQRHQGETCDEGDSEVHEHPHKYPSGKTYCCNFCDCKFFRHDIFTVHLKNHTGDKPFLCMECNTHFSRKRRLNDHKKTHSGELPFSCAECGAKFCKQSALKEHKAKQHESKCRITANRTKTRKQHGTESGEQFLFSCQNCNATFIRRSHFIDHAKTHSFDKSHSCGDCSATFSSKSNLSQHQKIHTERAVFPQL